MTKINVTFSKPMNTTSVRSAFKIIPVITGTFKWSDDDTSFVFSPVIYLKKFTLYTITITINAKDRSANALASPYTWNFTTGRDIKQPSVKDHFPLGTNVSITTNITVRFSEKMDKLSVKNAMAITPEVTGAIKWVENAYIFTPDSFLKFNTKYDVLIKGNAKDLAGNPLESEFGWNFTTVSEESSPPLIVDYSPTGSNVPLDENVRIEYVKPMDHSITEKAFSIFPDVGGGEFSWESNTLVFSHSSKFIYDNKYNVTVTTDAMDIWDNHLEQNFSWEFTTEPKAEIKILELSPKPGEIVEIDQNINIKFSKAITISLVKLSVENTTGTQVNGTVNYDVQKNELVFRLTDDVYYDYNSTYFVTLLGIKFDITGFNIVENGSIYTWSFTTKSEADADTDGDGMNDKWENIHGLDRFNNKDMNGDPDEDGLMNFEEYNEKTDPMDADSDDDGLNDSAEILIYKTDPLNPDSDDDGYSDGDEVLANTDPNDITDHPKAGEKGGTSKEDYTYIIAAIMIIVVIVILLFLFVHRKRAKKEDETVEDWANDDDKEIDKIGAEADEKDYGEWKIVDDDEEPEYSVGPRRGGPRQMRMPLGSKRYKPKRGKVELKKDKIPGKKGTRPERVKGSAKVSPFGKGKEKHHKKKPELHITDKSVRCNICLGYVKTGLSIITCSCGKHYHEKCGHRVGICPSCDTHLDKPVDNIAENDR